MKVQCISNLGRDLPLDCIRTEYGVTPSTDFALEVGKSYVVYALAFLWGYPWYYLCDESFSFYPVWHPSPLFKVVNPRVSAFWVFGCIVGKSAEETHVIMAYPEWVMDPLHYDRLTSGEDADRRIFERYRILIDNEAACTSQAELDQRQVHL